VIGKPHLDLPHIDGWGDSCPFIEHVLKRKERIIAAEVTIKNKRGEHVTAAVTGSPLFDDAGELSGAVELFRDITDAKRQERERKNILSMFAHDMKNPIAAAGGFLSRLISEKAGPLTEKQKKYLETIREEHNKISDLLSDFLEFSRIEAKAYVPFFQPFNLEETVRKKVDAAKAAAAGKNIAIRFEASGIASDRILADPSMIDRVIANLIDNAIAYTEAGGAICVRISRREGAVHVSVSDTGRGIAKDQLPYIFDAFYRASRDSKGSGLGLFIAKTIIEAHEGRLWVRSTPAKGSIFGFTLTKK
jgi:two-component system phosphate regulon sensor histidine kinase PhoR